MIKTMLISPSRYLDVVLLNFVMFSLCSKFYQNIAAFSKPCKTSKIESLTLLYEMGNPGPTKGNTQLIRQNNFSLTEIKLVYYLVRKILMSNSLVQNIYIFLEKNKSHCREGSALGPRGPTY